MDDDKPSFNVIEGGFGKAAPAAVGEAVVSPRPPPGSNLSSQERRVWDYICEQLREAGVEHRTSGLAIKVITRTYMDWVKSVKECDDHGRYATSKAGNTYELPHSFTEKQLKKDLLRWLPMACLTIPSLAKVKEGDGNPQTGDLFGELLVYASGHPG